MKNGTMGRGNVNNGAMYKLVKKSIIREKLFIFIIEIINEGVVMKMKYMVAIIVALIGVIGTISAAIIGVKWGRDNVNVIVQLDGKNIVLNDNDVQKLISENEELKNLTSDYKSQIEKLENKSNDLAIQLGSANGELDSIPVIEFQNLGLSINGEEKNINKEKSAVLINGVQYYSQEFVDNLLVDNVSIIIQDDMFYVGKIVKEKINLFKRPVVEMASSSAFYESIKDTYGNVYSNALLIRSNNGFTTFNAGREYAYLKCIVAMQDDYSGKGALQVRADGEVIYTSEEMTNMTEPYEIEIPINQASLISIGTIGERDESRILISNAMLYNQE